MTVKLRGHLKHGAAKSYNNQNNDNEICFRIPCCCHCRSSQQPVLWRQQLGLWHRPQQARLLYGLLGHGWPLQRPRQHRLRLRQPRLRLRLRQPRRLRLRRQQPHLRCKHLRRLKLRRPLRLQLRIRLRSRRPLRSQPVLRSRLALRWLRSPR